MRCSWLVFFALAACQHVDTYVPPVDDTGTPGDTGTGTTTDTDTNTDTGPVGTDADGDGTTVEAGDCDDNDIRVGPAWPEDPTDGKDNDCDGLIDEVWSAVLAFETDSGTAPDPVAAKLYTLSTFGDEKGTKTIQTASPAWMTTALDNPDAFVFSNGSGIFETDTSGKTTVIWDASKIEWPKDATPLGILGVAASPKDGFYYVSGANMLFEVDPDGTYTMLAQWVCLDPYGAPDDICPLDIDVDRYTGEVGMPGLFGGFATYTTKGGLDVKLHDDELNGLYSFSTVNKRRNGPWFAMGTSNTDGTKAIYKWDDKAVAWTMKGSWEDYKEFSTNDFAIEDESGDFYITAQGGWDRNVLRLTADGTYAARLYTTGQDVPYRQFSSIAMAYTHK